MLPFEATNIRMLIIKFESIFDLSVNIYGDFEEEHIHKFFEFFRRKISKHSQKVYAKFVEEKKPGCFVP